MKRHSSAWTGATAAAFVAACVLATPAFAGGQERAGASAGGGASSGGGGSATASAGGGSTSSGGSASSGGSGGSGSYSGGGDRGGVRMNHGDGGGATGGSGMAMPRGDRGVDHSSGGATPRVSHEGGATATGSGGTHSTAARDPDTGERGIPRFSRPRDGEPATGTAVPRSPNSRPTPGSGGVAIVPGGYYGGYGYPWGYGGYYGSYGWYGGYDPFYDPWYGGIYGYGPQTSSYSYSSFDEGQLRLKIKPKQAEVYIDGYYAGTVDDFDGVFQRLHLDSGAHRVEVRANGYETLTFDVRITPDHTTTYTGEMKKIQ